MDEKKKTLVKLLIGIPIVIILVFLCWPRENGDTEAAMKRNIVRERLAPFSAVEIQHVQDFVLEDAGETMRGVVFADTSDPWPGYYLHWYQLQEDGSFQLYWGDDGNIIGKMCDGVYSASPLRLHGIEHDYDMYYVNDPKVSEFVIRFEYFLDEEKKESQVEYGSVKVDSVPELICIPEYYMHDFAPEAEAWKGDAVTSRSCSTSISAFDENGNLLSGAMAKSEDFDLHKVNPIQKY
ncbi:hypothetical protein [Anaerotignum sp.]